MTKFTALTKTKFSPDLGIDTTTVSAFADGKLICYWNLGKTTPTTLKLAIRLAKCIEKGKAFENMPCPFQNFICLLNREPHTLEQNLKSLGY